MKKRIVVYGAGAIGRGFIPWVFPPAVYDYYFVETKPRIRERLVAHKSYTTYKTRQNEYEALRVPVQACFDCGEEGKVTLTNKINSRWKLGPRPSPYWLG